jgi:hypothetical protein
MKVVLVASKLAPLSSAQASALGMMDVCIAVVLFSSLSPVTHAE